MFYSKILQITPNFFISPHFIQIFCKQEIVTLTAFFIPARLLGRLLLCFCILLDRFKDLRLGIVLPSVVFVAAILWIFS